MLQGTCHLLHNSSAEDAHQLLVHLAHIIGGGCWQCIQECGRCIHILATPGEGGELPHHPLYHHGLACPRCQFALVQVELSGRKSYPLFSELGSMTISFFLDVILQGASSFLLVSHPLLFDGCQCRDSSWPHWCGLKLWGLLRRWHSLDGDCGYHHAACPLNLDARAFPLT
jgi:hypothetical protein